MYFIKDIILIKDLEPTDVRLPTNEQLDVYQSWVMGLIDDDIAHGGRVSKSGLNPIIYCCDGILEETEELTEHHQIGETKKYSRISAILNAQQEVEITEIDTERHQKEFGDILWYAVGVLGLLNIVLSDVLKSQKKKILPSIIENLEIARGFELVQAMDYLRQSAESFYRLGPVGIYRDGMEPTVVKEPSEVRRLKLIVHRDERVTPKINLTKSTGSFIVASSRILETNFGTTLADVLEQNRNKIDKRIKNDTVEKKNGVGGDDR